MDSNSIDPRILELCNMVTAKRARTVIDHIIKHGHITTEDLQLTYNYDHPPRAVRDVRENGIPLVTYKVTSDRTGRKIAAYRFGNPSDIKKGRIGGRQAFSKSFKQGLIRLHGSRCSLTHEILDHRYLQIDHRIPYEVAGDSDFSEEFFDEYMLLDASGQRAKSWSCENCDNFKTIKDIMICKDCYWAFPEDYRHVAMKQERRLTISWSGDAEVKNYNDVIERAKDFGVSVQDFVKKKLSGEEW